MLTQPLVQGSGPESRITEAQRAINTPITFALASNRYFKKGRWTNPEGQTQEETELKEAASF